MAVTGGFPFWRTCLIWRGEAALPRPHKVEWQQSAAVLTGWLSGNFTRLETLSRPHELNHRAMLGKGPVGEGDPGAGPLQQGAGDKYPEPEPAMLALGVVAAAPPRQIGFADALEDVRCDPRSVVGDRDLDHFRIPPRVHLDGLAGEIDGVFEDVADAVQDC